MSAPNKSAESLTVLQMWQQATAELEDAGVGSPRLDARLLLAHALEWEVERLLSEPKFTLNDEQIRAVKRILRRRLEREPVAYILGTQEFWSLDFKVTPEVLIPRPDSETLVEAALKCLPDTDAAYQIAELGTGSGCLLISLLTERHNTHGVGLDISRAALDIAGQNAATHGLQKRTIWLESDGLRQLKGKFHLLCSNPPYIPRAELAQLQPEVAMYEPRLALDGGEDGLDFYRHLAANAGQYLETGGYLVLEVGKGQDEMVCELLKKQGWQIDTITNDLAGVARSVSAQWQG